MKIIVFADIHANLEALETFLKKADRSGSERLYCLGDIIGYGPDPNACVEIIRSRGIQCVTGNHEDVTLGRCDLDRFNPDARRAIAWTIDSLSEQNVIFLKSISDYLWIDSAMGKVLLVHGSPVSKDEYIISARQAEASFLSMTQRDISLCFVAHTHQPCAWIQKPDGEASFIPVAGSREIQLKRTVKAIINVGSIGQPRDGNPQGCYVVWDDVKHTVKFSRFTYPFKKTQKKIIAASLPSIIANRLAYGF